MINGFEYDELGIYYGDDIVVNKHFTVTIPTIRQIKQFGERRYFQTVHNFTSVGADLKWQLWDLGIDYTKIEDYELFVRLISQLVSSKRDLYQELIQKPENERNGIDESDLNELLINPLQLIIKDIDFADYEPYKLNDTGQLILYDSVHGITFDRMAYMICVDAIRKIHGYTRNNERPANKQTKMDLIEDARDASMAAAQKPFKSVLQPLVSTLQVITGQCGDERILDMPISMLLDNVRRQNKVQDGTLLMQGAYSGFSSLKGIDKTRLDIFGDLN